MTGVAKRWEEERSTNEKNAGALKLEMEALKAIIKDKEKEVSLHR